MSKKNIKIIIAIIIILIIAFLTFITINFNFKKKIVKDKDYLYENVEQYLISQEQPKYLLENKDSKPNYNVNDFKVFTDLAKLGIRERKDEIHVYVWALVESYYVQDGKLINNSGSSMPYKFIFKNWSLRRIYDFFYIFSRNFDTFRRWILCTCCSICYDKCDRMYYWCLFRKNNCSIEAYHDASFSLLSFRNSI